MILFTRAHPGCVSPLAQAAEDRGIDKRDSAEQPKANPRCPIGADRSKREVSMIYITPNAEAAKYSEKPIAENTPEMIQNRMTTLVSDQPFFSK